MATTGEFPGDGKPKAIAFPDPAVADLAIDGEDFRYLRLEPLLELKLASGTSAPHRLRELDDRLDPSVREAYRELWDRSHPPDASE